MDISFMVMVFVFTVNECYSTNITMSSVIDSIFDTYDKKLSPAYDKTNKQVEVTVNMLVMSMYTIDESTMDFSMSFHFRERWLDERLSYSDTLNISRLELDASLFDSIWIPDVYILNEKSSNFHEVTVLNKMIHIYPDGTVQMAARVTGVFSCEMFLYKYPFDTQRCYFEIESYGHGTDTMKYIWAEPAVSLSRNMEFPQFELVDTKSYNCDKNYYGIWYPCIGLEFTFKRTYAYHIIQVYIPSILIVFLSWINFWLDCTAVPARVSVGLLTVVTITTQSTAARSNLPRVSYVKAIDVYMAACLAFVFLGIIEYAYVNVVTRVQSREYLNGTDSSDGSSTDKKSSSKRLLCFTHIFERLSGIQRARAADKVSRVLFPTLFFLFNIIYWAVYFSWEPQLGEKRV